MLTKKLATADYDAGRIIPDRLTRKAHAHCLDYAERTLSVC